VAYVPVKNAVYEFDVDTKARATTTARRQLVSNDNCNSCHGILGLPTGAGEEPGFHKGVRNNSEICAVCHNANQAGGYTLMTDGSTVDAAVAALGDSQIASNTGGFMHESYQAKRFIHGIHGGQKRSYAFTHCMNVGGEYSKQADGTWKSTTGVVMGADSCVNQYPLMTDNFTAEVAYPGKLVQCSNCHVKDSWKQDKSVLGSVVFKAVGSTAPDWLVISPKAATCTSCHDSKAVQTHVKTVGAAFGTLTQSQVLGGAVFESCEGCHASGSAIGVDTVHGLK
jgi:OmcA/MtrC family decaheme c-type cytochrome